MTDILDSVLLRGDYERAPDCALFSITNSNGDEIFVVKENGDVFIGNKKMRINPYSCGYCGSQWEEDAFHPSTCCNCGAPLE